MRIDIVTIFPGYLAPLHESLIGKAIADGIIDLAVHDLRAWTTDPHHSVDDTPYGGGPGMVMRPDVWGRALDAVLAGAASPPGAASPAGAPPAAGASAAGAASANRTASADRTASGAAGASAAGAASPDGTQYLAGAASPDDAQSPAGAASPGGAQSRTGAEAAVTGSPGPGTILVIPTPSGERFTQSVARELSTAAHLVFACGRYEGIDDRVARDAERTVTVRELSIGDYVLAGGEAAVLVMVEAIGRLLPGVLGNAESAADDSFGAGVGDGPAGLLESPVYTRPADHRGLGVPPVLLSGNHAAIRRWRRDESLRRTAARRPELLAALSADELDARDLEVLLELGVAPPAGLAERVAAERAAREAKRRRSRRSQA